MSALVWSGSGLVGLVVWWWSGGLVGTAAGVAICLAEDTDQADEVSPSARCNTRAI